MKLKKKMKLSTMTIFFAMLLGFAVMFMGTEQARAMEGDGSAEDPYEISTYAELKEFAGIVNGTLSAIAPNEGAYAILTDDIQCDDEKWVPIGKEGTAYSGTFDGQGKTIKDLSNKEHDAYDDRGLFGYIGSGATVQNVELENAYIQGRDDVGGVAGYSNGTITNCTITGLVGGQHFVGGVAGRNEGTIENCYNTGLFGGIACAGGVAGFNEGEITTCCNTGEVKGRNFMIGGVAGLNEGEITTCYNTGDVNGVGTIAFGVGGVAGSNTSNGTITNCYNIGSVSGVSYVGGVAGTSEGEITNCYNTGGVTANNNYVGGVAGTSEGEITNCYNTGGVTATDNYVGGVVGRNGGNLGEGTITNGYYDNLRCTAATAVGDAGDTDNVKGLTTEQMTGENALKSMVFTYGTGQTSPWMVKANDKETGYYPHLKGFLYDTTGDPDDWPPKHAHTWDGGKVTKKATEKQAGVRTYTCTVCKATKTETIPKLKPTTPKTSGTPLAKATVKKNSLTIGWNKIQGAEGYDVFFALCNHSKKEIKCKKVKTIKGNKTFKWTKSGLKKGTAYKFYVRAYVTKNGKKTYVSKTPMFHAYTGNGTKNYTNAKSVTVKKAKVSLKKGKTYKIKASVKKMKKNKKLMPKSHAPTLRYMTSDSKVATVSKSGKITAKGKGSCVIYVYAHNGVSKSIKVTVP